MDLGNRFRERDELLENSEATMVLYKLGGVLLSHSHDATLAKGVHSSVNVIATTLRSLRQGATLMPLLRRGLSSTQTLAVIECLLLCASAALPMDSGIDALKLREALELAELDVTLVMARARGAHLHREVVEAAASVAEGVSHLVHGEGGVVVGKAPVFALGGCHFRIEE